MTSTIAMTTSGLPNGNCVLFTFFRLVYILNKLASWDRKKGECIVNLKRTTLESSCSVFKKTSYYLGSSCLASLQFVPPAKGEEKAEVFNLQFTWIIWFLEFEITTKDSYKERNCKQLQDQLKNLYLITDLWKVFPCVSTTRPFVSHYAYLKYWMAMSSFLKQQSHF